MGPTICGGGGRRRGPRVTGHPVSPAMRSRGGIITESTITREFYEAFQRVEFARWDRIMSDEVLINSPAGFGMRSLPALKDFAVQFTDLGYRIDLVDEHLALDGSGTGRGFITFCLHWKHSKEFGGLRPTGREGTSVETCLLTIVENEITRISYRHRR